MNDDAFEMHVPRKGAADVLTPLQRKLPPPGHGEARITIEAAGVAYADIVLRQGLYAAVPLPTTPGYDCVGRVEALGAGVEHLAVGQRVAGVTVNGSYATRRNVDSRWLVAAPEGAEATQLASVLLNGLTAWQMFHRVAQPMTGDWVLVHGAAGGVGSVLLDLARLAGVRAIGTASTGKLAVVASRGGVGIDYTREDVVRRVRELSGQGVVAAFDHIGGGHFKKVSMPSLSKGGIGVMYGGYDATRGGKVNPMAIADLLLNSRFSSYRLFGRGQGVVAYSAPAWREARFSAYRHDLAAVLGLVADGSIKPLVAKTFRLSEAAEAHRLLESRAVAGKIVLVP